MTIDTGKILTDYFKKHRTHRSFLAKLMNINYNSLTQYQKRESIQTKTLVELSQHLQHNFFMDIALQLPPEYSTTTDPYAEKNQRIATLEAENKALQEKIDLLMLVLKK